jgi:hypothetical protein
VSLSVIDTDCVIDTLSEKLALRVALTESEVLSVSVAVGGGVLLGSTGSVSVFSRSCDFVGFFSWELVGAAVGGVVVCGLDELGVAMGVVEGGTTVVLDGSTVVVARLLRWGSRWWSWAPP